MAEANCDIGLIGLAVMGQNLVLNMNDHGYKVAVFNRTTSKVDEFLADEAKGTQVAGAHSIEEMCTLLKRPRRVMIMVKAGSVVDQTIEQILPHLEKGDIMLRVNPEVVKQLKSSGGKWLQEMEEMSGKTILVKSDPSLHPEQFDIH